MDGIFFFLWTFLYVWRKKKILPEREKRQRTEKEPGLKLGSPPALLGGGEGAQPPAARECHLGFPCLARWSPGPGSEAAVPTDLTLLPLSPQPPGPCPARHCGRWTCSAGCSRCPRPGTNGSRAGTPSWSSSGSARPGTAAGALPVTTRCTCSWVPATSPSAARRRPMRIRWVRGVAGSLGDGPAPPMPGLFPPVAFILLRSGRVAAAACNPVLSSPGHWPGLHRLWGGFQELATAVPQAARA